MTMPISRTALLIALLATPLPARAADDAPGHPTDEPEKTELAPVRVEAHRIKGYRAEASQLDSFGSFGNAPIGDTPATISVITRDAIDDRQPHSLSELARMDAAVGDNYAPIGYYQNLSIRGFPLDLATGYRMNGMTIAGEQPLALEDKQRVEILKGLGGLEAGVVSPGGLVNFVSKRPADVRALTLGTDSHGSRYLAADLGRWLTPQFGLRMNVAHEDIHSWVEHADGRRSFAALAADWNLTDEGVLRFDGNWQRSSQRSVSGYQLLGGTEIPPRASRTRMLGHQPWQRPTGIDARNASLRFDQRLGDWNLQLAASHSRALIDDSVAFAYGCFYTPECEDGSHPGWYFAPNGDYDIYDFRSPDDTRRNDEARAVLAGGFETGPFAHELSVGASAFRRTMDGRGWVYDYVGSSNIDVVDIPVFAPSPTEPGPLERRLTSWQRAVFALDRVHLGEHWQVLAGARHLTLDERAYGDGGELARDTRLSRTLPQAALMWQPDPRWTTYASYSESLSLGAEAPYWTSNGGALLGPRIARQTELGVKFDWNGALNLGAALYRLRQPWQFAQPDDTPEGFTFVERGSEQREGVELSAAGQLSDSLRLTGSLNWIRARATGSGVPEYEGHPMVNVPELRTALYLDWRLPVAPDVALLAGWRHAGANVATPNGITRVPAYDVFDLGLRYTTRWNGQALVWRLAIDNVTDRFYWRDTGSTLGDSYLFPGTPRLARLSLDWTF
jgi:iron complex outermembrane receptor protein